MTDERGDDNLPIDRRLDPVEIEPLDVTKKIGPYFWSIDGERVVLRQTDDQGNPLPDTEGAARQLIADAQKQI
ncbi:MAG: hypothetical protein KGI75_04205 [Rhizobiaceae bacterium]|nr:hypothetical protein [Rhizobiaceae bacterium]